MKRPDSEMFTPVEWEVMLGVWSLRTYAQIAAKRGCARRTVKFHARNAAEKIDGDGEPREKIIRYLSSGTVA